MELQKALKVVMRQHPCPHDNADTSLGDGQVWAKCEDCGSLFLQDNWEEYRQASKEFEDAIYVISSEIGKQKD